MHTAQRSYGGRAVEYRKLNSIAGGGRAETPELAQTELPKPPGAELRPLAQASAPGVES